MKSTKKLTTEIFIKRANSIHNNRYHYNLVEYKNYKTKVKIICSEHGAFEQTPHSHLSGQGCKKCYHKKTSDRQLLTTGEFIRRAKLVHGEKYNYSKATYVNAYTKVTIICSLHDEFEQVAHDHLRNNGCPACNESKGEKIIRVWLDLNDINYVYQKRFKDLYYKNVKNKLSYDFCLLDYNLLIEFDGIQHFKACYPKNNMELATKNLIDIQRRDAIKDKYASDNGIKLLRIPYTEYKNIDKILSDVIQGNTKIH